MAGNYMVEGVCEDRFSAGWCLHKKKKRGE
jgi:hypothetical protein